MTPLPVSMLLALAAAPSDEGLLSAVRNRFERAGRQAPAEEPALSRAARELAVRALHRGVGEAGGLLSVTRAVSYSGGWDPNPVAVMVRGDIDEVAAGIEKQLVTDEPVSWVGVGQAQEKNLAAAVVLLAFRSVDLLPFPRRFRSPPPLPQRLCGRLRAPLETAEVFVTRPGGDVDRSAFDATPDGLRCASLPLGQPGRHTVEILARGPQGPVVAALFFAEIGASPVESEEYFVEPATDADARVQLLAKINRLRIHMGAQALLQDASLDAVAQNWANRLAEQGFFSHVAPDGGDLPRRLREAGYSFVSAGENLGLAPGPLAAHFGLEHSPGHRSNLLDPKHRALGLGLARRSDGLTVLVEVFALPKAPATQNAGDARAKVYQALDAERSKRGLRALAPHAVLEALAQAHAESALAAGAPKADLPDRPSLHQKVFEQLEEVSEAAVDVVIADDLELIATSTKNLARPANSLVGVGVSRGTAAKFSDARYWIVVIYAAHEASEPETQRRAKAKP